MEMYACLCTCHTELSKYLSTKCLKQRFQIKMNYTLILLLGLSVFEIIKQKGINEQKCYAVCNVLTCLYC
jgi:hypothetical protein